MLALGICIASSYTPDTHVLAHQYPVYRHGGIVSSEQTRAGNVESPILDIGAADSKCIIGVAGRLLGMVYVLDTTSIGKLEAYTYITYVLV